MAMLVITRGYMLKSLTSPLIHQTWPRHYQLLLRTKKTPRHIVQAVIDKAKHIDLATRDFSTKQLAHGYLFCQTPKISIHMQSHLGILCSSSGHSLPYRHLFLLECTKKVVPFNCKLVEISPFSSIHGQSLVVNKICHFLLVMVICPFVAKN